MAKSRTLVNSFLERISKTAFDTYSKQITDLVEGKHGVYALYKNDRLYYVGLASNLRNRVKQHLKDKHAKRWNRFSLYLVRKVDHIKEIESLLLRIADPRGNKQRGRLRGATNLKNKLRRLMEEKHKQELIAILSGGRTLQVHSTSNKQKKKRRKTSGKRDRPLKEYVKVKFKKRIYGTYKGKDYTADIYTSGRIKFQGTNYDTPSAAARAITKKPTDGWYFWKIRHNGELVRLKALRK